MQGSQHTRLFNRWLEHAPDYASFGLVIICGFLLARLTWMLFPAEPRPALTTAQTSPTSFQSASPTQNLGEQIAGYHLFGNYQPDAAKPTQTNIQPTQLALKLQGVYAPAKRQGYAIIEENGQQKAYATGDSIGNSGAVLEQILAKHILLRRNGLLEKLELPKPELSGGGAPSAGFMDGGGDAGGMEFAPPVEEPPADIPLPDVLPTPEMSTPDSPGAVPPPQPELDPPEGAPPNATGNSLSEFRQSVLNNNMRLLEVASPQPYTRDGKFMGFQLSPGSNLALFNQLGLQAGDIVTAINGTALDSPATGARMLQEAATAPQINLNVTRNGQEINLPINFQ